MPQVEKYGAPRLGQVVTLNVGFMERLRSTGIDLGLVKLAAITEVLDPRVARAVLRATQVPSACECFCALILEQTVVGLPGALFGIWISWR